MDEITKAFENLKLSTDKKPNISDDEIINHLNAVSQMVKKEGTDRQAVVDHLVKCGILEVTASLLEEKSSSVVNGHVAELIAELAKTDVARKRCSDSPLIPLLIDLLLNNDPQVALQACRALGNICYDNDHGRSLVNEHHGTEKLLLLLQNCLGGGEGTDQLRVIATGFLLNLTNTYELTQEKVLDAGVTDVLCEYLDRYPQDDDLCTHILLTFNCIIDSELGRRKIMESNVCQTLIKLLERDLSGEVIETVMELLANLAENDAMKFQLATSPLCQILIKILKQHQGKTDEDSLTVIKIACDLVILLLTGDDSMVHLYHDGEGIIYKETIVWLNSSDENLQIAGALAIGNFARRDEHCIQMVSSGITNILLNVIRRHNTPAGEIRLQHAILSALRNLAIPALNKEAMVSNGVVDAILPMIAVETFPVVFKLLGTFRMLVDGQEAVACKLGQNDEFLTRLIEWCRTEDHPGVKGEANRLLAWIIKNSKSSAVMKHVLNHDGLPFLISMAGSEHSVMQNEALIALALIGNTVLDEAETTFAKSSIFEQLSKLLFDDQYGYDVKGNALALVSVLVKSENLKGSLESADIPKLAKDLCSHENTTLQEQAKKVQHLFESG